MLSFVRGCIAGVGSFQFGHLCQSLIRILKCLCLAAFTTDEDGLTFDIQLNGVPIEPSGDE